MELQYFLTEEPGKTQFPKQFCNLFRVFFKAYLRDDLDPERSLCRNYSARSFSHHPDSRFAADTVIQLSPDEATEGTMSSEALPLIFEPLEDTVWERGPPDTASVVTLAPGSLQPPADTGGPSRAPTQLIPDWTSPWQTSGTEQLEPSASPGPSASPQRAGADLGDQSDRGMLFFSTLLLFLLLAQSCTNRLTRVLFVRCWEDAKIRGGTAHQWPYLLIRPAHPFSFNSDNPSTRTQIRVRGDGVWG